MQQLHEAKVVTARVTAVVYDAKIAHLEANDGTRYSLTQEDSEVNWRDIVEGDVFNLRVTQLGSGHVDTRRC